MTRIPVLLLVALVAGAAAVSARAESPAELDLPHIGDPADNAISPAEEHELGSKVVAEIYRAEYVLEDAELADYITAMGWRLAASAQVRPQKLTFFMIRDPRINAFALPGGFIGVNAGLLLAATAESEVAGVLGHELTHVSQRHIARSVDDTQTATIATWLAVIAAIIAGSANPDVVIGALSVGQAINYQRQVNYTRAHELEADRIGIQTMARAGYNPEGMASFFAKMEQQARLYGTGLPEILRTHPLNTNRVAEARSRAAEMPKVPYRDSAEFGLMQARARVLTAAQPREAIEHFARQLASQDSIANRYGLALAQTRLGDGAAAARTLAPALAAQPRQANLLLLQGRIQLMQGEEQAGLATLARALQSYPRYAAAILGYADALMAAGRPEEARQLLISRDQALGTHLDTYSLLAQAARDSGNLAEASYQMASFLFLRGDAGGALAQLDAGLRLASLSDQDRARLLAKRHEVRETLPKNWRPADGREPRLSAGAFGRAAVGGR